MAVWYALVFVLANFGIAIAAKMPMITTTISSSMSVNPRRMVGMVFMVRLSEREEFRRPHAGGRAAATTGREDRRTDE
jgi:hypothetical protein